MTALKRTLGATALTLYGIGMILGAGVYSVLGAAAGEAGDAVWMSFLAGAVVALLTGLSYAELATMHPDTGAEHLYLSDAFPKRPVIAFVAGVLLALSACATAATVSVAFGGYLEQLAPVPPRIAAVVLLVAVSAINVVGVRAATGVTALFTIIEAAGLVVLIVLGVREDGFGDALGAPVSSGVVGGAALLFFAYLGFEQIAGLAAETKDPGTALPRAILVSVAVTTVLYVLVGLAAVALVPAAELAGSASPLLTAAEAASRSAGRALGVIALFATANTALATLVAVSRLLHGMARAKAMPRVLESVLPKRKTPWAGALAGLLVALLLALPGDVKAIASLSSFGALVAFSAVHACVIALRAREPGAERPFRVPLAIRGVPVLPVAGIALCLGLATRFDRTTLLSGGAVIAASLVAWGIAAAWRRR